MIDQSTEAIGSDLLRARRVVADNYVIVLAVFLILATVGVGATYTVFVDPGTQTEERTVSTWTRTAAFTHSGEVTDSNPLYATGTELSDRQVYYPPLTPLLGGTYRTSYAASSDADVDVTTELSLVVRGVSDGAVLWQSTEPVGSARVEDASSGQTLEVTYDFNLSREQARVEQIDSVLGNTPEDPEVTVRAETRVSGEINGRPVDRQFVDTLRFIPDGDSFQVDDPSEISNQSRQTRSVTVEREYSPLWKAGSIALLVIGIVGTGGLTYARRTSWFTLSTTEHDRLVEQENAAWISYGTLPETFDPRDEQIVQVDSLRGLIDLAADNDTRVIFDDETQCYVVLDTSYTYLYCRSASESTAIGPGQDDRAAPPEDGEEVASSDERESSDDLDS